MLENQKAKVTEGEEQRRNASPFSSLIGSLAAMFIEESKQRGNVLEIPSLKIRLNGSSSRTTKSAGDSSISESSS